MTKEKRWRKMDNTVASRPARRQRMLEMMRMRRKIDPLTHRPYTLDYIGRQHKVSRARVLQILQDAERKGVELEKEGAELTPIISGGEVYSRETTPPKTRHSKTKLPLEMEIP